ncbi:uncharacterized protein [Spinacia oleracea]|uniref:Integrase catalytic domain-containing protein n=1 Tax=Spinacia oleracea TaxID=3562 RepID=A0ABM3RPL1_SPIOL|nr:uncharacterized protein LOC130471451 [Spinacia oleracea]
MDWLAMFKDKIDCEKQKIHLKTSLEKVVSYRHFGNPGSVGIITAMELVKLVNKGNLISLCNVRDLEHVMKEQPEDIAVVNELLDVFSEEILGMSPNRPIDFTVDLIPETAPISKSPYRMAPAEMSELKGELEELLEKERCYEDGMLAMGLGLGDIDDDYEYEMEENEKLNDYGEVVELLKRVLDEQGISNIVRQLATVLQNLAETRKNSINDPAREMFKMVVQSNLPLYQGEFDPSVLENWLRKFDKLMVVVNCPGKLRVNNVVYYLMGETDLWWQVSKEEVAVNPAKFKVNSEWPTPKSVTEIRRFLSLAGYYRLFVQYLSRIAKPMRNDTNWVVVDRLTKPSVFIPMKRPRKMEQLAKACIKYVVRVHGVPKDIVPDRDSRVLSIFWESVQKKFGTTLKMSIVFHPSTYGQTERTI